MGLGILTGNEAVVTSGKFIGGIYTEGALTLSGGSADLLELGALNGIPVTLSGGSFDSIKIKNGADYQSLLAGGYAISEARRRMGQAVRDECEYCRHCCGVQPPG